MRTHYDTLDDAMTEAYGALSLALPALSVIAMAYHRHGDGDPAVEADRAMLSRTFDAVADFVRTTTGRPVPTISEMLEERPTTH